MKIICNTVELANACLNIQKATTQKSAPVLEGILIKAAGQNIELSGYDMEMGISTVIDARVEKEGAVVIPAKTFCEILKHLPKSTVDIEVGNKNVCSIKSADSEFSLIGMPAVEFPEMPVVNDGVPVTLPHSTLRDMVKQTIFATSVDDSKAVHKGIKFEIESGVISLIALDGYRLAVRKEAVEYKGESLSFIVPAKTLSEIIKFASDENDSVSIFLNKHHIVFNVSGYNVVSRLLEGSFLNYKAAIPQAHSVFVSVNTLEMIKCVERVSLVMSERYKNFLRCAFGGDMIKISCKTASGSASDRIKAETNECHLDIGFHGRFLLEALRAVDSDKVNMKMSTASSPMLISPIEGDSFTYLILPVKLEG